MPFIELNAKQRRELLNELIDEASNDELVSMVNTLLTRASCVLPQSYKDRIVMRAQKAFKIQKVRKSVAARLPVPHNEDHDEE